MSKIIVDEVCNILSNDRLCHKIKIDDGVYYFYEDFYERWLMSYFPRTQRLEINYDVVISPANANSNGSPYPDNYIVAVIKQEIGRRFKIKVNVILIY